MNLICFPNCLASEQKCTTSSGVLSDKEASSIFGKFLLVRDGFWYPGNSFIYSLVLAEMSVQDLVLCSLETPLFNKMEKKAKISHRVMTEMPTHSPSCPPGEEKAEILRN